MVFLIYLVLALLPLRENGLDEAFEPLALREGPAFFRVNLRRLRAQLQPQLQVRNGHHGPHVVPEVGEELVAGGTLRG